MSPISFLPSTQDFENNGDLKNLTVDFLEDIMCTPTVLPSEHRASSQLLRMLTKDESNQKKNELLGELLMPSPVIPSETQYGENFKF